MKVNNKNAYCSQRAAAATGRIDWNTSSGTHKKKTKDWEQTVVSVQKVVREHHVNKSSRGSEP